MGKQFNYENKVGLAFGMRGRHMMFNPEVEDLVITSVDNEHGSAYMVLTDELVDFLYINIKAIKEKRDGQ